MENKRRKIHEELEVVKVGYANGVAEGFPFTNIEKARMIDDAEEALEILDEIEENVGVCCAITMEPDEVLVLIDKLKKYLEK